MPGPGGASKGASTKRNSKEEARARWIRMDWRLKIIALVPPPWKQSRVGSLPGAPFWRAPDCVIVTRRGRNDGGKGEVN